MIKHKTNTQKTSFKKVAIATLLSTSALVSFSGYSNSVNFDNDCNVELEAGIRINHSSITFLDDNDNALYKILNDKKLIVNGEQQTLTSSQQALLNEYSTSIRAVVPQVKTVVIEGLDLAAEGVSLAFNELLGEGNEVTADLTQEFTSLRDELSTRFSIEEELYISSDGNLSSGDSSNKDDFFDEDFENRIENIVEKTMMKSMGTLMVAVGQQMLFSGGDADAFEAKMETFGEKIEQEIELRAEQLEEKANNICLSVVHIDQLEEKLRSEVSALSEFDVINVKYEKHSHKKDEHKRM